MFYMGKNGFLNLNNIPDNNFQKELVPNDTVSVFDRCTLESLSYGMVCDRSVKPQILLHLYSLQCHCLKKMPLR